jgi:SAM-dependent MidA family methyltransferase
MNRSEKSIPECAGLADRLRQQIRREGPITFRDWMAAALYDPQAGYYCRPGSERWGRAGDYRTSPERSPLFAATFARYFAGLYQTLHSPPSWTIIEAGAGDGHFAAELLQTLRRRFPEVFAATTYIIDEASGDSRAAARARLNRFAEHVEFRRIYSLPAVSHGVIFTNELFDAFPVHRVATRNGELCEMYVGVDQSGDFAWTDGPLSLAFNWPMIKSRRSTWPSRTG